LFKVSFGHLPGTVAGSNPSTIFTGLETISAFPGSSPFRDAAMVIVPAERVARTATRLMPHSVLM
jgi:hypothetical protein